MQAYAAIGEIFHRRLARVFQGRVPFAIAHRAKRQAKESKPRQRLARAHANKRDGFVAHARVAVLDEFHPVMQRRQRPHQIVAEFGRQKRRKPNGFMGVHARAKFRHRARHRRVVHVIPR